MEELHTLQISQLIDLLSKYTDDYTRMPGEGTSNEEYEKCKMTIKALHAEIESRKGRESTNIKVLPDFIA